MIQCEKWLMPIQTYDNVIVNGQKHERQQCNISSILHFICKSKTHLKWLVFASNYELKCEIFARLLTVRNKYHGEATCYLQSANDSSIPLRWDFYVKQLRQWEYLRILHILFTLHMHIVKSKKRKTNSKERNKLVCLNHVVDDESSEYLC